VEISRPQALPQPARSPTWSPSAAQMRRALEASVSGCKSLAVARHPSASGFAYATLTCQVPGYLRQPTYFSRYGVFHRLGVTPNGSQVVFEVTDDDALTVFPQHALSEEQKGIFIVNADGSGQERLSAASREPPYSTCPYDTRPPFVFSPDGSKIAYTDRDDQGVVQIVTFDLATRVRSQVTHLPPAPPCTDLDGTFDPFFNDDGTITFFTYTNADRQHPDHTEIVASVKPDGTLTVAKPVAALPGSEILTSFRITGAEVNAASLPVPGSAAKEVFVVDQSDDILQLTDFSRPDTLTPTLSADGQRVIFAASANPLGKNPKQNCQLFSIDRLGNDLRQLTDFHEGPVNELSKNGCLFGPAPSGCNAFFGFRDLVSNAVVFYSTCDPFNTNPNGSQVFAIRSDGTGLSQLTYTQGYTKDTGGVTVELPFPFAYPGFQPRQG
jgi:WD40 repeat protein